MTKHDVRIRRGSFSKGQIERHRDFKKFSGMYEKQQKKSILGKLWVVVVAVIFVVIVSIMGYYKITSKEEKKDIPAVEQQK